MRFPTKYSLALQILCICHLYQDQRITSNFIAEHTGADSSIIRYTMLDLKKKNYITSKPGPGGTTLCCDLAKVSLFDVYELVADPMESPLKFYNFTPSSMPIDMYIKDSTDAIFENIKTNVFSTLKEITVMDICNNKTECQN